MNTNTNDRFAMLKARVERSKQGAVSKAPTGPAARLWVCPRCSSVEMMMHIPVWVTGSVDQEDDGDVPAIGSDQDIYEQIKTMPVEFECLDCKSHFAKPDRASEREGSNS